MGGVEICYMRHHVVGGWSFSPCSVRTWELELRLGRWFLLRMVDTSELGTNFTK